MRVCFDGEGDSISFLNIFFSIISIHRVCSTLFSALLPLGGFSFDGNFSFYCLGMFQI